MKATRQKTHKPPLRCRRLRAEMILKNLSLKHVARRARIHYSTASSVLNGKLVNEDQLKRLAEVVASEPMEATA